MPVRRRSEPRCRLLVVRRRLSLRCGFRSARIQKGASLGRTVYSDKSKPTKCAVQGSIDTRPDEVQNPGSDEGPSRERKLSPPEPEL
jgi:hypothetical protein